MSGIVKGVKKVFKKVGKVVKKVAPYALAIGAVVYTAGAALGVGAMAGGWGAAVTNGLGALGISGTSGLAGALTGAITQAGYGAVIGGVGSLATGGDFGDGAAMGAMAGAVTGGVMGGLGMPTDPLKGIGEGGGPQVGQMATDNASALPEGFDASATANGSTMATPGGTPPPAGQTGLAPPAATTAAPAAEPSTFDKIIGSPITGNVIEGIGGAMLSGSDGDDAREDREARAASYRMSPGASGLMPSPGSNTGLRSPSGIYPNTGRQAEEAVASNGGTGRKPLYRYDPATGTIIV